MGPMGTQGPQEGTPRGTGTSPEAWGTVLEKVAFWPPGVPPSNPEKSSQKRAPPSLWDPSQSLRAAFLVQAGTKNASGASTGLQNRPRGGLRRIHHSGSGILVEPEGGVERQRRQRRGRDYGEYIIQDLAPGGRRANTRCKSEYKLQEMESVM